MNCFCGSSLVFALLGQFVVAFHVRCSSQFDDCCYSNLLSNLRDHTLELDLLLSLPSRHAVKRPQLALLSVEGMCVAKATLHQAKEIEFATDSFIAVCGTLLAIAVGGLNRYTLNPDISKWHYVSSSRCRLDGAFPVQKALSTENCLFVCNFIVKSDFQLFPSEDQSPRSLRQ